MTGYVALFLLLLAGEMGLIGSDDSPAAEAETDDPTPTPEDETGGGDDTDTGTDTGDDTDDGDDTVDPPGETPAGDLFDTAAYSEILRGTNGDDLFEPTGENLAWFLDAGNDTLEGSPEADFVDAGDGDDSLTLREGDDIVLAGAGNDAIDTGIGADLAYGQEGGDSITGNGGDDTLFGGVGDDTVVGGSGADLVYGGDGNDLLSGLEVGLANGRAGNLDGVDTLFGGAGDDILHLGPRDIGTGGDGADLFRLDDTLPDLGGGAQILDFDVETDVIEVLYTPETDANGNAIPFEVEATGTPGGTFEIRAGDRLIGTVNVPGGSLTAEMIRLVAV